MVRIQHLQVTLSSAGHIIGKLCCSSADAFWLQTLTL